MKIFKILSSDLDAILLALILCINCLRVSLGLVDTTFIFYVVYFLCAIILYRKHSITFKRLLKKSRPIKNIFFLVVLMASYALLSLIWSPIDGVLKIFLKFILSLFIGILAVAVQPEKIKKVLLIVIIINIGYSILLLSRPSILGKTMGEGLNYLNATLPLGLALSLSLVRIISLLVNKGRSIYVLLWLAVSLLFFVALLLFSARGVLLFPPLIMLVTLLVMKKRNKLILWLLIPIIIAVLLLAYSFYINTASDYAVSRMFDLFESTDEEDRWELWSKSLHDIKDNLWFIFGGGIQAFEYNGSIKYYPHNIFIEVIGEYGILGIIISITLLWNIFTGYLRTRLSPCIANSNNIYYCVMGGFVYYTLTFCKSFSLYEGLPLFVFIGFCFSMFNSLDSCDKD